MSFTVKSREEAWKIADELFDTDYMMDQTKSLNAGYDIYSSTLEGYNGWISDLGNRLEVNTPAGTTNIWIDEEPSFAEYQLEDALKVISEAIYEIDDMILPKLQEATGIDEARSKLYGAYAEIKGILDRQHPTSKLYKMFNL